MNRSLERRFPSRTSPSSLVGQLAAHMKSTEERELEVTALAGTGFLPLVAPTPSHLVRFRSLTTSGLVLPRTHRISSERRDGRVAATVAVQMVPLAHTDDGGSSIKILMSCWGLVGLEVSRWRAPSPNISQEGGSVEEGLILRSKADDADHVASRNLALKIEDRQINRFTPYTEVKKILDARFLHRMKNRNIPVDVEATAHGRTPRISRQPKLEVVGGVQPPTRLSSVPLGGAEHKKASYKRSGPGTRGLPISMCMCLGAEPINTTRLALSELLSDTSSGKVIAIA